MTGRGVEVWKEFGSHIGVYRDTWSADLIGVDTLFLGGPAELFANLDGPAERRTLQGVRQQLAESSSVRHTGLPTLFHMVCPQQIVPRHVLESQLLAGLSDDCLASRRTNENCRDPFLGVGRSVAVTARDVGQHVKLVEAQPASYRRVDVFASHADMFD